MVVGTVHAIPAAASREELDTRVYAVEQSVLLLRQPSMAVGSSYTKRPELTEVFMAE